MSASHDKLVVPSYNPDHDVAPEFQALLDRWHSGSDWRNGSLRFASWNAPRKFGCVAFEDGPPTSARQNAPSGGSYFCDTLLQDELSLLRTENSLSIEHFGDSERGDAKFFTKERTIRRGIGYMATAVTSGGAFNRFAMRDDLSTLAEFGVTGAAAGIATFVLGLAHDVVDNSVRTRHYKTKLQKVTARIASPNSLYVERYVTENAANPGSVNQSIDASFAARHPEVYDRMLYKPDDDSGTDDTLYGAKLYKNDHFDDTSSIHLAFIGYDLIYRHILAADDDPSQLWNTFLGDHMRTFIAMQRDVVASQVEFERSYNLTDLIGDDESLSDARTTKEVNRKNMNTFIFEAIAYCAERQARQRVEKATQEQRAVIETLISGPQSHRDDVRPAIAIIYQEVEKSMVASSIATETDAQTMRELADYVIKTAGLIATIEEIERVYKSLPQKFGTTFTFPDWSDIEHKVAEAMLPEIEILR